MTLTLRNMTAASPLIRPRQTEGTPKTFRQAIVNGLSRGSEGELGCGCAHCDQVTQAILDHGIDFLAQKFTTAMLQLSKDPQSLETVRELWEAVKTEAMKEAAECSA